MAISLARQLNIVALSQVSEAPDGSGELVIPRGNLPSIVSQLSRVPAGRICQNLRNRIDPAWMYDASYIKAIHLPSVLSLYGVTGISDVAWRNQLPRISELPEPLPLPDEQPPPSPDAQDMDMAVVPRESSAPSCLPGPGWSRRREDAIVLQGYDELDHATLVAMLRVRDKQMESAVAEIKNLRLQLQSQGKQKDRQIRDLDKQVVKFSSSSTDQALVIARGRKDVRLTTAGACALAIRKGLSNIASSSLGSVLLMDISHQTVCRTEVSFGARLQASFRTFHQSCEADLQIQVAESLEGCGEMEPRIISCMSVHRWRSDATNSSIWNKNKLLVTELESFYISSEALSSPSDSIRHAMFGDSVSMRRVCDILPVIDASGKGTYCTVRKVCSLSGFDWAKLASPAPDPLPRAVPWRLLMYISDGGPDQAGWGGEVGFKELLRSDLADAYCVTFVELMCLHHALSLVFNNSLKITDTFLQSRLGPGRTPQWHFYSSIAKINHLWRDNSKSTFKAWQMCNGHSEALRFARKLPGRICSGRWGSVGAFQQLLNEAGFSQLESVLSEVTQCKCGRTAICAARQRKHRMGRGRGRQGFAIALKRATPLYFSTCHSPITWLCLLLLLSERSLPDDDEKKLVAASGHADDPRVDEQTAHRAKQSRWKRDAMSAAHDELFWLSIDIADLACTPLNRFQWTLEKRIDDNEIIVDGSTLGQLVFGKAMVVHHSFAAVLTSTDWASKRNEWPVDLAFNLLEMAVLLVSHNAAGFFRRICRPMSVLPLSLCWFAFRPPDVPCQHRAGVLETRRKEDEEKEEGT
eukprot:9467843-Pyramimonas_sp.AAC.3